MLTPAIRAYLAAARAGKYLLAQVIADLTQRFNLSPLECGTVIAADIDEQA